MKMLIFRGDLNLNMMKSTQLQAILNKWQYSETDGESSFGTLFRLIEH